MRRRRLAFTTLELLVVMGIILFLISLLFLGLKHVAGQGKIKDTQVALQTANNLLNNYRNATQLARTPAVSNTFWSDPVVLQTGFAPNYNDGTNVFAADGGGRVNPTYASSAILRTVIAMQMFETVPDNAAIMNNLTNGRTVTVYIYNPFVSPYIYTPVPGQPIPSNVQPFTLLADGWGNPILFVPSGGLWNVLLSADSLTPSPTWHRQFSTGLAPAGHAYGGPTASDQPFFVSCGPDGDLSRSDDNIYSFQGQ